MGEQVKGWLQVAECHSAGAHPPGERAGKEGKRQVGSQEVRQAGRQGPVGRNGLQLSLTSQ